MSSKRLAVLEKMTQSGHTDPFAWYALAMEYKSLDRVDDALATFEKLRELDPSYVPMYLMCATLLIGGGHTERAREWFSAGIGAAQAKGDAHALAELQDALAHLG